MQKQVRAWLEDGKVDVFLAYKMDCGHPLPHTFTRERIDETADLVTGPARYSLEKFATQIAARHPEKLSLIHISEPTRQVLVSRMPSSA